MFKRIQGIVVFAIIFVFVFEQTGFPQMAGNAGIPNYISGYVAADRFRPVQLRSIAFDGLNNDFDLYLDKGDNGIIKEIDIKENARMLSEYFHIGIVLPNSSFWVNLRPDARDKIIDPYLEKTDLGKVMLEADLQLKKDMAGFTSPNTVQGRKYWDNLYDKAQELFGQADISVPTVTRPWIVPGEIIIRQSKDNAYIYKATLKVMLEQDHLKGAADHQFSDERIKALNEYSSELIRNEILPKLTREVNSSRKYAALRQVYYSLILAQWFKQNHKNAASVNRHDTVINKIDSRDTAGLTSKKGWAKDSYFKAYQRSFASGEYNIKETVAGPSGITVRQYFSGGENLLIAEGMISTFGQNNAAAGGTYADISLNMIKRGMIEIKSNSENIRSTSGLPARDGGKALTSLQAAQVKAINSNPVTARIRGQLREQMQLFAGKTGADMDTIFGQRLEKIDEFLAKIAGRLNNTDPNQAIHPDSAAIRVAEKADESTPTNGVLRIGIYPVAANPLHWDHFLAALESMAEVGLDKVIFDIQSGKDTRKPILGPTEKFRYELAQKEFDLFAPLFSFSENVSEDGETDIFRILKLNPKQKIDAFYIVGGDHYNRWAKDRKSGMQAPDDMLRGTDAYNDWKAKYGEPPADTLQKLEDNPAKYGLSPLHSMSVIFIKRGNPKPKPVTTLKNLEVLDEVGDAAATDIREALKEMISTGKVPERLVAILPYTGYEYILNHPEYLDMLVNPEKYEKKDGGIEESSSLIDLIGQPDELLFDARKEPDLLLKAIEDIEAVDPKDARLITLYETALQVKNLKNVEAEEGIEAIDPSKGLDLDNASQNAGKTAAASVQADAFSLAKRLQICAKLRQIVKPDDKMKGFVDYHSHTFRSDGEFSPSFSIYLAWRHGMKRIGVVDHNTSAHFQESLQAAKIFSEVEVWPGIEVDVSSQGFVVNGKKVNLEYVHMPVYFPNATEKWLDDFSQTVFYKELATRVDMNNAKLEIMRQRFNKSKVAREHGLSISVSEWAKYASDVPNWAQIVAVLKKKYGSKLIDGFSNDAGAKTVHDYYANNNIVENLPAGTKDNAVRARGINFWEKNIPPKYPSAYGIDLGALLNFLIVQDARLSLAHPYEGRNYWQSEKKIYESAAPEDQANMLYSVIERLLNSYPDLKQMLWGIEVYSAKHSQLQMEAFEKMTVKIEKLLGGRKLERVTASDTHNNDYESEGGFEIGTGDKDNLKDINEKFIKEKKDFESQFNVPQGWKLETEPFPFFFEEEEVVNKLRSRYGEIKVLKIIPPVYSSRGVVNQHNTNYLDEEREGVEPGKVVFIHKDGGKALTSLQAAQVKAINSNPVTARIRGQLREQMQLFAGKTGADMDTIFGQRLEKIDEFLAKIAGRLNNTDPNQAIHPDSAAIRVAETADEFTPTNGVLRIGIYPVAGNPLHWDHFLAALETMAEVGLDKVIFDVQSGKDTRKPILGPTEKYRYELIQKEFELFAPLFSFSENVSEDGETDIFRILKLNPKQKIDAFYIVGGDHYNRWAKDRKSGMQAPDDMLRGTDAYNDWKAKYGEPPADTLQKLEDNPAKYGLSPLHSMSVIFIKRGNPKPKPVTTLKNLEVLDEVGDAAATDIREALKEMISTKKVPERLIAILPYMGYEYIMDHTEYLDMLADPEKYEASQRGQFLKAQLTTMVQSDFDKMLEEVVKYLPKLKDLLAGKGIDLEKYVTIDEFAAAIRAERADPQAAKAKKEQVVGKFKREMADVVDENDVPVVAVESGFTHIFGLRHRTANAFVLTPDKALILQKRVHNKTEPKKASIPGGHVTASASYGESIARELVEELDLRAELERTPDQIGLDGQFKWDFRPQDREKDKYNINNEFRSLYVYKASENELKRVNDVWKKINAQRATMTEVEFEVWLKAQQDAESGYGEVWDYIFVDNIEALRSNAVKTTETYSTGTINPPVEFTSDLLEPLMNGTYETRMGTVDFMKELMRVIEDDNQKRQSDGGIKAADEVGGVDFRATPQAIQPAVNPASAISGSSLMSLQELDKQWSVIQKKMAKGEMPYKELKGYVSACSSLKDNAKQLETITVCISNILKLEEERALPTAPELKEILAYLG